MEIFLVVILILIFVFLNSLPYLVGSLATAKDFLFLGTIHWPEDYFYYLSQFAQGRESWFTGFDLFTSDFKSKTLVGWVNIFLGRTFYLLGINHFLAYQFSIIVFAIGFLGVSYLLIREIFPEEKERGNEGDGGNKGDKGVGGKRIVAFVLFVISNAFPRIINEGGRLTLSYYDFWFNNGLPFNRLGGVPHHLVARTSISAALLLALLWWKGKRVAILWFTLLGFVLASVEPVHWGLVIGVLFFIPIIIYGSCRARVPSSRFKIAPPEAGLKASEPRLGKPSLASPVDKIKVDNLIGLFFFLGGLPMALYLKNLFAKPPYLQLSLWEATQQIHPTLWQFILGNGPVAVLAILGLPLFCRNLNLAKLLALLFTFVTLGLYFSPIPEKLSLVNVRFLPATTTLFLACFAAEAIFQLTRRFGKKRNLALGFILGIVIIVLIPTYFLQIKNRATFDTASSFFYISKKTYAAYNFAQKVSNPKDTFLVIWPFNWSFPAATGRRVFEGHNLLTVDYEKKKNETREFFFGEMEKGEMGEFIAREKIDYIMTYPWTRNIDELKMVEKIYDSGYLAVYKVKK